MKQEILVELYVLKCASIRSELDRILDRVDVERAKATTSVEADNILREYAAQIDLDTRRRAAQMAEYYRIFYMLENFIREFVASALEADGDSDWWDQSVPDQIKESAARSKERELNAGVTPRSDEMIVYTTFGELMGIISHNWPQFAGFFTSKRGLENVMGRLNTLRGPIMHCGELAEDEVLRLKLSVRDWFKLFVTTGQESAAVA